ncbi:MAG TPA: 16S rRNA processing protein RimM [Deltaproteobacteria bacterium]|nr:16S rRNA processing protein RimM [Deltaproteobacteria bacterium]
MNTDLIEIARIKGPNGLKGKMWITPYGDSFETFSAYTHLIVGEHGSPKRMTWCVMKKGKYIIELEGISCSDQVESIKGEGLFITRDQLERLNEDEFYWCDLYGMNVVSTQGEILGELVKIFSTGSNDVYVVDTVKQYYIPATKDVIKEISLENRTIVVDTSLLEGLIG